MQPRPVEQFEPRQKRLKVWVLDCGTAILAALVFSGLSDTRRAYFQGFNPELLMPVLGACLSAAALLLRRKFSNRPGRSDNRYCAAVLAGLQLWICAEFILYTDGRLIFSDDHPSFLYRLKLLLDHFPAIPFYNTAWNAGYLASEFPVVGATGIFFVSWPLIGFMPDFGTVNGSGSYTLLLPYLFVILVPWAVYNGAKLLRFSSEAALLSGVLALAPSLLELEWLLKFGTIGFVFSTGLLPLLLALGYRVFFDEEAPKPKHACAFAVISALTLSWVFTGITLIPAVAACGLRFRSVFERSKLRVRLGAVVLAFLLCAPSFYWVLFKSKAVSVAAADSHSSTSWSDPDVEKKMPDKPEASHPLFQIIDEMNPLLLAFLFPGLWLLSGRMLRPLWALTLLWILLLALFGDWFKPQLEFRRLLLHFAFLSIYPAASAVIHALRSAPEKFSLRDYQVWLRNAGIAVVLGAAVISPLPVCATYLNQSPDRHLRYIFASADVQGLTDAIKEHGGSGRTMFLGFILHELGARSHDTQEGGHVAPLAAFTGHELFAYFFVHQAWTTIDPIPEKVRHGSDEGVEDFLDLLNVSSVVTFDPTWRRYCKRYPERYQQVYVSKRFRVYRRLSENMGPFLKGRGTVSTANQGLSVTADEPELVLKYRYYPELSVSSAQAEIFPVFAYENDLPRNEKERIDYIGLRVNESAVREKTPIEIRMR